MALNFDQNQKINTNGRQRMKETTITTATAGHLNGTYLHDMRKKKEKTQKQRINKIGHK